MPNVSIIMGVYNCANRKKMLQESVNSIINQTYRDWELIICDDGSTDDTYSVLLEISKLDSRIIILHYSENKGLAYALNYCIEKSSGNYIARQDDDDISTTDRLEKQIQFMEIHSEFSIVGTNADVFDENGIWGEYITEEYPQKKSFLWNSPFIHPTVIMKKTALVASNCYRIAKETRRCEDYDLFMSMYALGYKGCNLQEKLYQYRITVSNKKYRQMKYRFDEAKVRKIGYKKLGLGLRSIPYILKPIIIGLIPQFIFKKIRKNQYKR